MRLVSLNLRLRSNIPREVMFTTQVIFVWGGRAASPQFPAACRKHSFLSCPQVVRVERLRHSGRGQQVSSLRSPEELRLHLAGTR